MPPEPVSPELVLVDPELAERERARLCEKARLEEFLDVAALRRAVLHDVRAVEPDEEPAPVSSLAAGFLRRRVVPATLLCSLVLNGYFVADLVVRSDDNVAAPVAIAAYPAAPTSAQQTQTAGVAATHESVQRSRILRPARKTMVEHKLVSLVLSAPARKLPRAFIDPKTGLVRNNVQVSCRAAARRSYLCTIGAPGTRTLVVRYRIKRNGMDTFRWYGYSRVK